MIAATRAIAMTRPIRVGVRSRGFQESFIVAMSPDTPAPRKGKKKARRAGPRVRDGHGRKSRWGERFRLGDVTAVKERHPDSGRNDTSRTDEVSRRSRPRQAFDAGATGARRRAAAG